MAKKQDNAGGSSSSVQGIHGDITPQTVLEQEYSNWGVDPLDLYDKLSKVKGECGAILAAPHHLDYTKFLAHEEFWKKLNALGVVNDKKKSVLDKTDKGKEWRRKREDFEKLEKAISTYKTELPKDQPCKLPLKFKLYQHGIAGKLQIAIDKPFVRHYAIDSSEAKYCINTPIRTTEFHPIEECLIRQAIDFLRNRCDAQTFVSLQGKDFADNMVLVDIFVGRKPLLEAMGLAGTIPAEKKGRNADIHTVVLWKTGVKEVTVIDPNNKGFSSFLDGKIVQDYKIVTPEIQYDLIHTNSEINENAQRNCTDIAAKLAFTLHYCQKNHNTIESVIDETLKRMDNQTLKSLKALNDNDMRSFHSSDELVRSKARESFNNLVESQTKIKGVVDNGKIKKLEDMDTINGLVDNLESAGAIDDFNDIVVN